MEYATLERMLRKAIDIEGNIRVLQSRCDDDPDALTTLRDNIAQLQAMLPGEALETAPENRANGDAAPEPEPEAAPEPATKEVIVAETVVTPTPVVAPTPAPKPAIAAAAPAKTVNDLRKIFTVNDKFLFKRELFGGNSQDFDDTLELLQSMDSYHEAAEYLLEDLAWDPESQTVINFLASIESYFNNR